MIRKVFGRLDDFTEILLPDNLLSQNGILQHINNSLAITDDDFKQVELIGWLYQFYIADRKDEVFAGFKKNQKARAEDIPAATQIFTPRWIVRYMVENTVGRIWLDQNPDSILRGGMKYLVAPPSPEGEQANPTIPQSQNHLITDLESLKLLDPASGSGHILVEGFDLLFKMYDEEGYSKREAAKNILKNNLFGLDIDARAVQLAQFAVLLKAAQLSDKTLLNADIMPHIHAMPAPYDFSDDQIQTFIGEKAPPQYLEELKTALTTLQQGRNIGSALIVEVSQAARAHIQVRLDDLTSRPLSFMEESVLPRIQPFIDVLLVLSDRFEAVAANPPYMGNNSMNDDLRNYLAKRYPKTKGDLFTVFMESIPHLTKKDGFFSMINLPSWLFLGSFEDLRKVYIDNYHIQSLLHMGRGIFGIDFGSVVFTVKKSKGEKGNYFRLHERVFQHIQIEDIEKLFLCSKTNEYFRYNFDNYRDVENVNTIEESNASEGKKLSFPNVLQNSFEKITGSPISYWVSQLVIDVYSNGSPLFDYTISDGQNVTGDNKKFLREFWEVDKNKVGLNKKWLLYAKGGSFRKWSGNITATIDWSIETRAHYKKNNICRIIPEYLWYRKGISWSLISSNLPSFRILPENTTFDKGGSSIFIENKDDYNYFLAFLNTNITYNLLKISNPTLNLQVKDIRNLPIIDATEIIRSEVNGLTEHNIKLSETDWNAHETSWDFEKSPLLQSDSLRNAYAAWETAVTNAFWQLHGNEERLNELFIGIYGLEEELTPSVSPSDVTILQSELKIKNEELRIGGDLPINRKEVMAQFLNYLLGCLMGRYRLDKTGLHIAHADASVEECEPYTFQPITNNQSTHNQFEIDEDGIVPIMGKNSPFSDDIVMRLKTVLQQLWGEAAETDNLNFINACLEEPLEEWLTNPKKHWEWHKRQYHRKPIYWLFASSTGKDAAFKALVYQHRITRHTVGTLLNKYVLKHLQYLREESERLKTLDKTGKAAKEDLKLLQKFEKDIVECEKYVEVLKPLQDFDIDLDDGVAVNYAKFGKAVVAL